MPFQILSLSGGGYLGLYTICVLAVPGGVFTFGPKLLAVDLR